MNPSSPGPHREILDLLDALREGTITEEQRRHLHRLLAADREAVKLYCEYVFLTSTLRWSHAGSDADMDSAPAPSLPQSPRRRLAQSSLAWSVLAASVLFAAYFVGISWDMLGKQLASSHRPEPVATILETDNVEWSGLKSETRNPKTEIAAGQPLSIQSGLIELQLKQGTSLLIEGPADWKITGENSATFTRGKLVAKVPRQAVGFTLETPIARIVDLGTEFGVTVTSQNGLDLQVLTGKVDVHTLSRGGNLSESVRLLAGEAARVEAVRGTVPVVVEKIAADRSPYDKMIARSKLASALDLWRVKSRTLRSDPTLVAYYDFEDRDQLLRNALEDKLHGQVSLANDKTARTEGRWFGKGALAFGEGFATATVPHDPELRFDGDWSIALWLRLDQTPSVTIPVLTKGQDPRRQCSLWVFPDRGGTLHLSVNDTAGVNRHVSAAVPVPLNRWSYVVGTYGSKTLRLFLNGEETGEPITFPLLIAIGNDPLLLGKSEEATYPQVFTGAMDGMAIYRRALSSAEVNELFQTGRPE